MHAKYQVINKKCALAAPPAPVHPPITVPAAPPFIYRWNSRSRSATSSRTYVGRPWLHCAECGVRSISRSRWFISAIFSRRPARTDPWHAIVAAIWLILSSTTVVAPHSAISSAKSATIFLIAASFSSAGTSRTITPAPKSSSTSPSFAKLSNSPASAAFCVSDKSTTSGSSNNCDGSLSPAAIAALSRSSTIRSCAACWSTRISASSACARI